MISSNLIISILIAVTFMFTGLGIIYSKGKIKGADDFFTARNSAGVGFLSTTFMASFLGVFILFTPPEAGAIGGIATVFLYAIGLLGLYLAFIFLGPKIRNYLPEGSTLNDFVKKRYGSKMFLTFSVSIFYMMVHLVAELTAIALVAKEIAGIPMLFTALLVGLCVMIYTAYGGLKASMFTDLIQMTLVMILLAVVGMGVYTFVGSPGEIIKQAKALSPNLMTFNNKGGIEFGLTLMIAVCVANLFHQGYWQRIYASKNSKALKILENLSGFGRTYHDYDGYFRGCFSGLQSLRTSFNSIIYLNLWHFSYRDDSNRLCFSPDFSHEYSGYPLKCFGNELCCRYGTG